MKLKSPQKQDRATEIVGTKPAWELWAEAQLKERNRGDELLAAGCFTVGDFQKKMPGWTNRQAACYLERSGLKSELAIDSRTYQGRKVRFYFPPKQP